MRANKENYIDTHTNDKKSTRNVNSDHFKTFCQENPKIVKLLSLDKCNNDLEFVDVLHSIENKDKRIDVCSAFMDSYCQFKYVNGEKS